ncbi:tetratricopeptide repeat protein [Leptospira harrisiae]|uniref:tetratricopeptide repeat protein n=1 Tax=Leptospira harrisiae TaxID=2023189 RepID=UPI001A9C7FC4|nr:tetratricopeptide repeat protein [Leptospira harrisiae]
MKGLLLFRKFILSFSLFFCFAILNGNPILYAQTTELFLPFPETWTKDSGNERTEKPTNLQTDGSSIVSSNSEINSKTQNSSSNQNNPESTTTKNQSSDRQETTATNAKPLDKKKKKKEVIDPSKASFQKGKAYLTRGQKKSAESEFADSYGKEGDAAKFSRVENTNLFGLDGKEKDSAGLVEKQEDSDLKIKTQFELARSLDRIGNADSEEKAYKEYLKLVTEFPKHPDLTPRSHYAMAVLLIRKKEFRSAAHQLVNIIKNFKESSEFLPAHYYLGKVYESSWEERDLERALKYYQLYMNGVEGKTPVPGYDFRKETRERLRVLGSSI